MGGSAVHDGGDVADVDAADALVGARSTSSAPWTPWSTTPASCGTGRWSKMTPEEWDAVIRVHLRGHYAPTPRPVRTGGRKAARLTSCARPAARGLLGNFGQANYGAAKAGIAAFSTIVAQEMARYGVHVQCDRAGRPDPDDGGCVRRDPRRECR